MMMDSNLLVMMDSNLLVMMETRLMKIQENNECKDQEKEDNINSTNNVNTISSTINAAGTNKDNELPFDPNMPALKDVNIFNFSNDDEDDDNELPFDPNMPALKDVNIFNFSNDDEDDGIVANMNNLDITIQVNPIPTTRSPKDHTLDQVVEDLHSTTQTRNMSKNLEEHGFVSTIQQRTSHKDIKNYVFACFLSQEEPKKVIHALKDPSWIEVMQEELLQFKLQEVWTLVDLPNGKRAIGTKWVFKNKKDKRGIVIRNKARLVAQGKIEEEVYVCQPPGFEDLYFLDIVYKVEKVLYGLHQAPRACLNKKELCNTFERLMHEKFQMSSMRELIFFLGLKMKQKKDGIFISQDKYVAEILKKFRFTKVKTVSTPMKTQKPLLKDKDGKEVDVYMYRLMIDSLMYLTSSRPDIMFAVCACARYQVNQKEVNFSKWIFDSMIRNLDNVSGKFLMYPRKPKRKNTQVPQPSGSTDNVANEAFYKELGDSLVRAATTASSLEAKQDSDMFDMNDLVGEEVFVTEQEVAKDVNENVVEEVVNAAQDSTATTTITTEELTLAKALKALKTSKPKVKGIVIQEQKQPGIPNEHQLKFNSIKDAKQLLEAIEKRFGRDAATKKNQRNLLKQQYENFTASISGLLDQTFDRIQKLMIQLELLGEKISQENVSQKVLRSLSPQWNIHVVVWGNKADLDTMSMDDLYKNLKVYETEVKRMPSSISSIHNMDFVSSLNNNSSSTNGIVNTA
nr:hypothetical protein [Tanacetum cinerariifolium]